MRTLYLIIMLTTLGFSTQAQEILTITSGNLPGPATVLVIKPERYNPSTSYPLVYLLHGYSENYQQWKQTVDLQKLANLYQMILVCPEGFVSYYINSIKLKNSQYETFFFQELVPTIHKQYIIDQKNIFISGLSMGGYGALRYIITHPKYFNTAASTSGALEIDYENFKRLSRFFFKSERMSDDLTASLGRAEDTNWQQFSITTLLKQAQDFNKPFLLDCGIDDPFLDNTLAVKDAALKKKLPITLLLQPGEHNSQYWSRSILHHLLYFNQHMKTNRDK